MQCKRFESGGFVLHKIQLQGKTFSAWFNANGELMDAEWRPCGSGFEMRKVPNNWTNVRQSLRNTGLAWRHAD